MATYDFSTGLDPLDDVLHGLRKGDNVVWQVDDLDDYIYFVEPLAKRALEQKRNLTYFRFAPHKPVLNPMEGLEIIEIDASRGFDYFSSQMHHIIDRNGLEAYYVLDSISYLVEKWATDELLANFFQVTCPYLFELDTITYFALARGKHSHNAVARIRDTTQILIDVYTIDDKKYIHPLKVWDRYSPQMFMPHVLKGEEFVPVIQSGYAAQISTVAQRNPLKHNAESIAPWESVYDKLLDKISNISMQDYDNPELKALKYELCRMLFGNDAEMLTLADEYMSLEELFAIRERVVGSGRIGGKAAGMLVARAILENKFIDSDILNSFEEHDSFYIGSDVFFTFLVRNNLFRMRLKLSRSTKISPEEYEEVQERFLAGTFPSQIVEQFRNLLDYYGQAPVIVRSSSLLEDSFGSAFAGKYDSIFCANQGDPETRLTNFMNALKLVYASALNPSALHYRRKRGLAENDEQMAILVQRVSGQPRGKWFYPTLAGVAFSRNLYAWNSRIDPKKGIIRLVFGLGTRAVDRVGGDYPRMIAISHPTLRPEVGMKIVKYSQKHVDLLNLETNKLETMLFEDITNENKLSNLHLLVSTVDSDNVSDSISRHIDTSKPMVLTFNNLIKRTKFVSLIDNILTTLEDAYGHPVDTEFTASIDSDENVRINLLQCRPLWLPGSTGVVEVPENISEKDTIFKSERMVSGGVVDGITHVVYINPHLYNSKEFIDKRGIIGRIVGKINDHPLISSSPTMMVGPGRWGSNNIDLGVNVTYSDINNTVVLVEVALESAGQLPEVSYGTHFFLDLVEDQVIYLAVYPDNKDSLFNEDFFMKSENCFNEFVSGVPELEPLIKVIDVKKETGKLIKVVADPQARKAVCFLE
ncbi:MAG: PEP/pyruvate-binding domain-containing protein [Armatimonadota bacterium]